MSQPIKESEYAGVDIKMFTIHDDR